MNTQTLEKKRRTLDRQLGNEIRKTQFRRFFSKLTRTDGFLNHQIHFRKPVGSNGDGSLSKNQDGKSESSAKRRKQALKEFLLVAAVSIPIGIAVPLLVPRLEKCCENIKQRVEDFANNLPLVEEQFR
jgi:hypothetical protein